MSTKRAASSTSRSVSRLICAPAPWHESLFSASCFLIFPANFQRNSPRANFNPFLEALPFSSLVVFCQWPCQPDCATELELGRWPSVENHAREMDPRRRRLPPLGGPQKLAALKIWTLKTIKWIHGPTGESNGFMGRANTWKSIYPVQMSLLIWLDPHLIRLIPKEIRMFQ